MRGSCTYTSLHHVPHGERHRSVCHYDGGRRNEWMNEWRAEGREGGEVCRCGEGSENLYLLDFVCSRADVVKFVISCAALSLAWHRKINRLNRYSRSTTTTKKEIRFYRVGCVSTTKRKGQAVFQAIFATSWSFGISGEICAPQMAYNSKESLPPRGKKNKDPIVDTGWQQPCCFE